MNFKMIVKLLLDNKILQFGDFHLASGRASPYYFNLRTLSDSEVMSKIGDLYAEKIYKEIGIESFDILYGVAYAGILPSYLAAESLWRSFGVKKRFAFNRKESKKHGDSKNKILAGGQLKQKDRILMIDDVLTTGETKLGIKTQLEEAFPNITFRGLLVFLDRCEIDALGCDPKKALEDKGLPVFSILSTTLMLNNPATMINKATRKKLERYLQVYGRAR